MPIAAQFSKRLRGNKERERSALSAVRLCVPRADRPTLAGERTPSRACAGRAACCSGLRDTVMSEKHEVIPYATYNRGPETASDGARNVAVQIARCITFGSFRVNVRTYA